MFTITNTKVESYMQTLLYTMFEGRNIGNISKKYDVLLTPDDKTFVIWTIIYRGLISFIIKRPFVNETFNDSMRLNREWIKIFNQKKFRKAWIKLEELKQINLDLASAEDNAYLKYYLDIYATWTCCASEINKALVIKYGDTNINSNNICQDKSLQILNNFIDYIINDFSAKYGKQLIPSYDETKVQLNIDKFLYKGQVETLRWAMQGILCNIETKSNGFNLDVIKEITMNEKLIASIKNKMIYLNIYPEDNSMLLSKTFISLLFYPFLNIDLLFFNKK